MAPFVPGVSFQHLPVSSTGREWTGLSTTESGLDSRFGIGV